MKKLILAIGAVVLLGLASSCVDSMTRVDNPNYDPIKDVVTTQFVLNIAPAENATSTKQSGNAVQRYQNFRGLGNATLFTVSMTKRFMGQNSDDLVDGMMIPFISHSAGGSDAPTTLKATSVIPLSTALGAGAINPLGPGLDESGAGTPKSRRVIEVSLPTNTNTLLFYGEAITGTDEDAMNSYGALEYTSTSADLTEIGCHAMPRMKQGTTKASDFDKIADMILAVVNHLFLVGVNGNNLWDDTSKYGYDSEDAGNSFNFGTQGGTTVSVHWADFKNCKDVNSNTPLYTLFNKTVPEGGVPKASQMEILLGTAYNAFTEINANELRAGSGAAIERQVQDLYAVIHDASESAATNDQEAVAKVICREIIKYIECFFTINSTTMAALWKPMKGNSGVQKAISDNISGSDMPLPTGADDTYTLHGYPFHFDLPMGAVTLIKNPNYGDPNKADKDMIFAYNTKEIDMGGMGGGKMSVYDYTYPPSLCYFGNAPIRISRNNSMTNRSFPDGVKDSEGKSIWENKSKWEDLGVWITEPEFGHVSADTRGVAMAYNIQYGNALMETYVKFDDSDNAATSVKINGNKLVDNNANIHPGESDKEYSIGGAKTISLTGILIGGQPSQVGWTYIANPSADFNQMIYDKMINGATQTEDAGVYKYVLNVPTDYTTTTPNYTVVFDNYVHAADAVADDQNGQRPVVYVALEFQNNLGEDFWGNENMVRNGGTFYIIGKLQLANAKRDKFSWDNCSKIMPPYVVTGQSVSTKQVERIFMADHTTSVTFVIGKNSLKSAYVTVPDLRAAKMAIGLSVDLEWKDGLYFDNVVLGAE